MHRWLPHNLILHHLHLLQLENYNIKRFLRVLRKRFLPQEKSTPEVDWTMKLYAVVVLAFILQMEAAWQLAGVFVSSTALSVMLAVVVFVLLGAVFFVFTSVSLLILWPVDQVARQIIIWRAKRKMRNISFDVVGITGSYGKTTMKETVATILSEKLNVTKTAENKNTPLGIARTIMRDVTDATDVFVVEMGAYERGDIKKLCGITPPDIAILTGINEAHLERFGSIENTIAAKFEIVEYARKDATVIANADDERVREHIDDFITNDHTLKFYTAHNNKRATYRTTERNFHQDGSGISFELMRGSESLGKFKVPHLAEYIIGNVMAALEAAQALGIAAQEVRSGISKLTPAPHRLEVSRSGAGVVVIDDSYNGNPDGAHAAIETLGKFKDKRRIYVTPGLVEMGDKAPAVHKEIGRELAHNVELVVLIATSASDDIKAGLEEEGYEGGIVVVDSMEAARGYLGAHVEEDDVVLFQNDWPENYV